MNGKCDNCDKDLQVNCTQTFLTLLKEKFILILLMGVYNEKEVLAVITL